MDRTTVEQAKALRFRFLKALYEATKGNPNTWETAEEVGKTLGLSEQEAWELAGQYADDGYLEQKTMGGHLQIQPKGRRLVEEGLAPSVAPQPASASQHYDFRGATVNGSQIQLNSPGAAQSWDQSQGISGEQLLALVAELRRDFEGKLKTQDQIDELQAQLATLEAQAKSKKPNPKVVGEILKWVSEVAAIAFGDVGGHYLKAKLLALHLLPLLPL